MEPRMMLCDKIERDSTIGSGGWWVFRFVSRGSEGWDQFIIHDKNPDAFRAGHLYKVSFEDLKPEDKVTK
jgi:hypothetical protein